MFICSNNEAILNSWFQFDFWERKSNCLGSFIQTRQSQINKFKFKFKQ